MENLIAIMLLVGCSGDASACREVPTLHTTYASVAACEADLPIQMRMRGSEDDRVFGACAPVEQSLVETASVVDWSLTRAGTLSVRVEPEAAALVAERPALSDATQAVATR